MHTLSIKIEREVIAHDAFCRAFDTVGDYWNDRYGKSHNLSLLQGMFGSEILAHYEKVASGYIEEADAIEEEAAHLAEKDGFLQDETHGDIFIRTLIGARVHIPEFSVVRYKGGGFSCSFLS